jgi:heme-degrading monooxygenase HmoA
MQTLAEGMPGFMGFKTLKAKDGERVSVIEFEFQEALRAWREHSKYREAQKHGRRSFYAEFQIQVCWSIMRQYGFRLATSGRNG